MSTQERRTRSTRYATRRSACASSTRKGGSTFSHWPRTPARQWIRSSASMRATCRCRKSFGGICRALAMKVLSPYAKPTGCFAERESGFSTNPLDAPARWFVRRYKDSLDVPLKAALEYAFRASAFDAPPSFQRRLLARWSTVGEYPYDPDGIMCRASVVIASHREERFFQHADSRRTLTIIARQARVNCSLPLL